ncbi:methyl-accepting chemotaxis protein [Alteribacillus iranensis]|uniref:Methyl-accepting chemotaxis protein n=1 Tax=Alteribacillus iranensis TaxID=930128 RepID=A0A1I2C098_9BACI|nr:methyl-accepting chemotaxis protein [Alteribacillus iranensis]SFE61767.1 methyl-accepting chemotaxis protein [Alteribacillus iranensis]
MKWNSIRTKIVSISIVSILLISAISGFFLYQSVKNTTELAISNHSVSTAENVASQIDPDLYRTFLQHQEETPVYWELRNQLNDIREKTGALYIYTMGVEQVGEGLPILVDGQPEGSDVVSEIGEISNTASEETIQPVLNQEAMSTEVMEDPDYGNYLSAFAPIQDTNGEVIGVLGVDIDAGQIDGTTEAVTSEVMPIFLISMGVLLILMVVLLSFYIIRSLKPLEHIRETAEKLSDGDLAAANENISKLPVTRNDEVGKLSASFYGMVQQLKEMIEKVASTSEHVAASSEELFASAEQSSATNRQIETAIQEVASGSRHQMKGSEESVDAMEEMSTGVQHIAESATAVSEIAVSTLEEAQHGEEAIRNVHSQMESIHRTTDEYTQVVGRLDEHSQAIVKILDVITDISDQTNLLALNAAIEAARAGEHGRSFAVVSDEIRQLADESRKSVEQITGIVANIQEDMKEAVHSMKSGQEEVQSGTVVVQDAGRAFQQILQGIERVTERIQEVSALSEEMSAGSEQVKTTIGEMTNIAKDAATHSENVVVITKEQIAAMKDITESSEGLSTVAQELQDMIHRFKI